ncbi:MAG: tetratricopeptide repeat protein [bacterium]
MRFFFLHLNKVNLFIFLSLIFLTMTAYWEVRRNDFINLDDNLYVTENSHVQKGITLKGIFWAFTSTENGQWHPITWLSHMIDYQFFGLDARGHHMTNLLLHIINTLLLFILLYRMTAAAWQSGFVAALFALHPLHVESVAWISERKDVLCAFFWILALMTYFRYVKNQTKRWRLLLLLCFIFAVMAKSMAVTLPFVLLLLDYWPLSRMELKETDHIPILFASPSLTLMNRNISIVKLLSEKLPLFSVSAVISLFTIFTNYRVGSLTSVDKLSWMVRFQNAAVSYVGYISKMFWPSPLAVLYPHQIKLPFWHVAWAASIFLIITVLVLLVKKKRPYLVVGWMWYVVTLLPVIGLVQAGIQRMADRFAYIPMIGLLIIVVYGCADIVNKWHLSKAVLSGACGLVLLILMLCTKSQVILWRNSITLFEHTLSVTANNYLIYNNLGVTLARQGKDQKAFLQYQKALEINPRYADAHYNLGKLLARQSKDEEAMVQFMESLRIKPEKKEAHNDLGVILNKHGRIQEAVFHFAQAIRIDPNYREAHFNMGAILFQHGKYGEAVPYFNEALRINPSNAGVHNSLAATLAATGKIDEAIIHYHQALQIDNDYADAHYDLGSLLNRLERRKEAIVQYDEVLRLQPSDAHAHYELAVILNREGKRQDAIVHLSEALRIIPNYEEAHLALGEIYLEMKKKNLAYNQYRILRTLNKDLSNILYQKISNFQK